MNGYLHDILEGREDNYMLPFYWQHGGKRELIPEQVQRIYDSGCRAFCVESRPHRDFCGAEWWGDMDVIIAEAEKRNMRVWILDDDHFPTGHAVGAVKKHPELRKWQLTERHVDVMGPVKDALLLTEKTGEDHIFLGAFAYERTGEGEECAGEPLCLNGGATDGFLRFSLPKGCYRVFCYYKTRAGTNQPDYIDMLDPGSVRLLIDTVYEPHYERYKAHFGKTVAGFFSDEPSFGNGWHGPHHVDRGMYDHRVGMPGLALPYSDKALLMMKDALGYDPVPYLSALWFEHRGVTAEIRHAYMDAVTKLYRDSFTRQLGDWCESHGVMYIGHIIEDMNAHARLGCSGGHYFRSLDGQHMSGIDIVLHQIIPGMAHYRHTCSSFGNMADPEFFDYVLAKLASSFAVIGTQTKGRAMCEVFGAYGWAENAATMKWLLDHLLVRGVNYFVPHAFSPDFPDPDCPPHFGAEGKDPQFEGFSALMRYGNRVSHLLSRGRRAASAAILYHADAEWMNEDGEAMLTQIPARALYDEHIDFDIIPADCFLPDSGSRVFPAEAADGRLRIGGQSYGALVVPYAKKLPDKLIKAFDRLEKDGVKIIRMRKDHTAGELTEEVTAYTGRDITVGGTYPLLRCAHFVYDGSDAYMFVNESVNEPVRTDVTLAGKTGDAVMLDLLGCGSHKTEIKDGRIFLDLAPYQSVIVVTGCGGCGLSEKRPASYIPAGLAFDVAAAGYDDMENYKELAKDVGADGLSDIGIAPDFSGRIRYTCRACPPDGVYGIDLGDAGDVTHLFCNGTDLGVRICPPYSYDLSGALKDGENELLIYVSNTLANAVKDGFSAFLAIKKAGLHGDIKWIK
ncbi:MAG: hypothetical protein J5879_06440 [Clostridia bacterium]|nr:hypothetical protein [Clostridia bacterium]